MTKIKPFDDLKEEVLRVVLKNQIKKDGSLSSAAFRQSSGVSVNRTFNEGYQKPIECFEKDDLKGKVVVLNVNDVASIPAKIEHKPTDENIYHSEIYNNESNKELTRGQAKRLTAKAKKLTINNSWLEI